MQNPPIRGDGLAQWLERWTGDPQVEGSNPFRQEHKPTKFFPRFKEVVLTLSVGPTPVRIRTHTKEHAHVKDPVVHVRVPWITETRTDPACIEK